MKIEINILGITFRYTMWRLAFQNYEYKFWHALPTTVLISSIDINHLGTLVFPKPTFETLGQLNK